MTRLYLLRVALAATLVVLSAGISAFAQLTVSPIFSSDMVLQRGTIVPVFGTSTPGSTVTVQFSSQSRSAVTDASGKWRVDLSSMSASASPASMTISSGTSTITLTGVQVGEVWLCSGQSNMGWPLEKATDGSAAIASAGNHNIRLFRMTAGNGPSTTTWKVSNATNVANFSAVGYWMGLELSRWFGNVPVGLIQATHDGTAISQWQHTSGGTGDDYDAMVRPIMPFAVKGVAWYQGESNGGDAAYASKLRNMISEWRTDWNLPNLPFGIIQLAYRSGWNVCRNAQLEVADTDPNAFLVVIRDLPGGQLHPTVKKPVGIRTAIGARGKVYGEAITYSGPIRDIANTTVSGNKVILRWKFTGNGLFTTDNAAPGTFMVGGSSGQLKTATAVIVGNTVEVWSSQVSAPTRVQYAYSSVGNLYCSVSIPTEGGSVIVDRLKASEFQFTIGQSSLTSSDIAPDSKPNVKVSPNPARGSFTITDDKQDIRDVTVTVTDLQGNVVFHKETRTGDLIDVNSHVRPGTYLMQITEAGKVISRERVVIE